MCARLAAANNLDAVLPDGLADVVTLVDGEEVTVADVVFVIHSFGIDPVTFQSHLSFTSWVGGEGCTKTVMSSTPRTSRKQFVPFATLVIL